MQPSAVNTHHAADAASSAGAQAAGTLFLSGQHSLVLTDLRRILAGPPSLSAVTGDAGLGKTTLMEAAIAGWPGPVRVVRGGSLTVLSALASLAGRATTDAVAVLVVDDAHELCPAIIADLSRRSKISPRVHVVLVGQTCLWDRLREAVRPRGVADDCITNRAVLFPMSFGETDAYLQHVFRLAGCEIDLVLPTRIRHDLIRRSGGNMRRINAELAATLAVATRLSTPYRRSLATAFNDGAPWLSAALARAAGLTAAIGAVGLAALVLADPDASITPFQDKAPSTNHQRPSAAAGTDRLAAVQTPSPEIGLQDAVPAQSGKRSRPR